MEHQPAINCQTQSDKDVTFEGIMVSPVGEDVLLDIFIQTLLHAIEIFDVVGLSSLHGSQWTSSTSFLEQTISLCLDESVRFRDPSLSHNNFNY